VSISDVHVVRLPSGLQAECSGKSLLRVINAIPHIESGPVQPKANANGGLGVRESQGSKPMPPLSREMDDSLIRLSAFRAGAALVNGGLRTAIRFRTALPMWAPGICLNRRRSASLARTHEVRPFGELSSDTADPMSELRGHVRTEVRTR
jgi:hypothetical protein